MDKPWIKLEKAFKVFMPIENFVSFTYSLFGMIPRSYSSFIVSRHHRIRALPDKKPVISNNVFVAPNASVIGKVVVGTNSSIWYGAIVRGDVASVTIGESTNIQDRACIHLSNQDSIFQGGTSMNEIETVIGNRVSIGHGAVIQGAEIQDECLVGMGAILMEGCKISKHAIVGSGKSGYICFLEPY